MWGLYKVLGFSHRKDVWIIAQTSHRGLSSIGLSLNSIAAGFVSLFCPDPSASKPLLILYLFVVKGNQITSVFKRRLLAQVVSQLVLIHGSVPVNVQHLNKGSLQFVTI